MNLCWVISDTMSNFSFLLEIVPIWKNSHNSLFFMFARDDLVYLEGTQSSCFLNIRSSFSISEFFLFLVISLTIKDDCFSSFSLESICFSLQSFLFY